ncbi:NADP-dependent oxidoreductase [Exilibacterium tricleocarpae]|uniref:NADP-dependent oxidoreductase n=1 Tax=Exilibacterium tricleocarpae TaxID=2591008 RepID=A0A545TVQ1_9GAMM|nr:NADP-dependent oxidoreductase [Exilibacterium tricleocarpae]TQV81231.1 NADP-dependent oxidoreductase [Exilibacterium tricleocarpae]
MNDNLQVQLARNPAGVPVPEDFTVVTAARPQPAAGEVLCQTLYLSLDPYMRSQIAGRHLSGAVAPGEVMRGETVSRVVESRHPGFAAGDTVRCFGGWQSYSVHGAGELYRVDEAIQPVSYALSVLGMPGLTAYAGLIWQAEPRAGDVVVIPAAIGGVGATAGQLAKIHGCRVIGIAGSDEKCRYAVDELGYDACINRRTEDIAARLDQLCPQGIDIFFDLVGGEILQLASQRLAVGARVILCGLMAEYNSNTRAAGPEPGLWIKARARVHGLVVYDFEPRRAEFINACLPYVRDGRLQMREDIAAGLAAAPVAFCRLMRGENLGKALVKIAEEG